MKTAGSFLRFAMACLTLMAFGLGAAIPKGWMPAQAANGDFVISICASGLTPAEHDILQSKVRALLGAAFDTGDQDMPSGDSGTDGDCPYGVFPYAAALNAPDAGMVQAPFQSAGLFGAPHEIAIGRGLAAPPPPARGPPASV